MSERPLSSETLHVSSVAKDGVAILISGPSGAGKSDLALRLIDRGAKLVSDDYTIVRRIGGRLIASAPSTISGKLEVRGLGILDFEPLSEAPVGLFVDLDMPVERMPERVDTVVVAGIKLPAVAIDGHEPSAPTKVELALDRFGVKS
jgi:serine kinase of HPr protein (carbohydrate metabolism regulator)